MNLTPQEIRSCLTEWINMNLTPQEIRDIRGERTQEVFAELLGVTIATLSRWENGHAKPLKSLQRQIRALKIEPQRTA